MIPLLRPHRESENQCKVSHFEFLFVCCQQRWGDLDFARSDAVTSQPTVLCEFRFAVCRKKYKKKIIARSTRYTIYHLNNYTVDLPLISPWKRFRCLKSNAHANWICTLLCTHQSGEWIFVSLKEIVVDTIDMSNGQMIEMRSAWQHIKLCLMTNNHAVSRLNCNHFGYNLFMNFSIELLNGFSFNI